MLPIVDQYLLFIQTFFLYINAILRSPDMKELYIAKNAILDKKYRRKNTIPTILQLSGVTL